VTDRDVSQNVHRARSQKEFTKSFAKMRVITRAESKKFRHVASFVLAVDQVRAELGANGILFADVFAVVACKGVLTRRQHQRLKASLEKINSAVLCKKTEVTLPGRLSGNHRQCCLSADVRDTSAALM